MRRQVEQNDGSLLLRMPSRLKRRLEQEAERRGISVAALVRAAAEMLLDQRYGVAKISGDEPAG